MSYSGSESRRAVEALNAGLLAPFELRAGKVTHEGVPVVDIARQYSTPFILSSLPRARRNAARIRAAFSNNFKFPVRAAYSLKACYLPHMVEAILSQGWDLEVMSEFELSLARRFGAAGHQIILSGLGWGVDLCRRAMIENISTFIVDSWTDINSLRQAAFETNIVAPVYLRVNLEDKDENAFVRPGGKLGMLRADALAAAKQLSADKHFLLKGIHMHHFNRLRDVGAYVVLLRAFTEIVNQFDQSGVHLSEIDIGGGLESLWRLDASNFPIEKFAEMAANSLRLLSIRRATIEIGRAIVADACLAVGRVVATKNTGSVIWVIVDFPTNTLIPIPGAKYVPVPAEIEGARPFVRCSFSDGTGSPVAYCEDVEFPEPAVGQIVCFLDAGAYTTVFTELWAHDIPTIISMDAGRMLVRDGTVTTSATQEAWYGPAAWVSGASN